MKNQCFVGFRFRGREACLRKVSECSGRSFVSVRGSCLVLSIVGDERWRRVCVVEGSFELVPAKVLRWNVLKSGFSLVKMMVNWGFGVH